MKLPVWDSELANVIADQFPTREELEQRLYELFNLENTRLLSADERKDYQGCLEDLKNPGTR